MWETTSSFSRVAVLALATAAFAAAWSGDQKSQAAYALARRDAWRERTDPALAAAPTTIREAVPTPTVTPKTVFRRVTTLMELPADIAPGRYRVVEPSGRVVNIIIADDPQSVCAAPCDLYHLDLADGGRRYFVRIDAGESELRRAAAANGSRDYR